MNRLAYLLSDREQECMNHSADGLTSLEIAALLGISEKTVGEYQTRAVVKLGAKNKTHSVALWCRGEMNNHILQYQIDELATAIVRNAREIALGQLVPKPDMPSPSLPSTRPGQS